MKKLLIIGFAMLLGMSAMAQITGSAHDFSAWATGAGGGANEMCIACHTPHTAVSSDGPIWNHTASAGGFTTYGTTIAGTTAAATPGTESLICLSCHDGSVNLDAYGGSAGTLPIDTYGGGTYASAFVDVDLSDDHPVGITYTVANDLNVTTTAIGTTGLTIADKLYAGAVECASCHDVHNAYNESFLLMTSNANSALCMTCHDK